MKPLDLVKLTTLLERSSGSPEVIVGLIDVPVAILTIPILQLYKSERSPGKKVIEYLSFRVRPLFPVATSILHSQSPRRAPVIATVFGRSRRLSPNRRFT